MLQCAPVISAHIFLLILLLLCHTTSSASREIITRVRIERERKPRQSSDRALRVYIRLTFAMCCSVLQCVAVYCSALQCVAVCCSVMWWNAVCCSALQCVAVRCSALQCVTVCCSVLQRVAVCCSALQCVAVQVRIEREHNSRQSSNTVLCVGLRCAMCLSVF